MATKTKDGGKSAAKRSEGDRVTEPQWCVDLLGVDGSPIKENLLIGTFEDCLSVTKRIGAIAAELESFGVTNEINVSLTYWGMKGGDA